MGGNPMASASPFKVDQMAPSFHHNQREAPAARPSSPPSSSPSSSLRVAPCSGQDLGQAQEGATSSTAGQPARQTCEHADRKRAAGTVEDPDLCPLWPRPARSAVAEKATCKSSSAAPQPGAVGSPLVSPCPTSSALAATPAAKALVVRTPVGCQYPGCERRAKYGPKDEPPSACQAHKRAGQYTTNRHGDLYKATRDGDAFRTPAVVTMAGSPQLSAGDTGKYRTSNQSGLPSKASSINPSSSPLPKAPKVPSNTVPGLKPSGKSGLPSKACSVSSSSCPPSKAAKTPLDSVAVLKPSDQSRLPSKDCSVNSSSTPRPEAATTPSNEVAGLKRTNRPGISTERIDGRQSSQKRDCLFPGCKARPTHGLPGAVRAVYCSSHKKGVMVHLYKDSPDVSNNAKAAGSTTAGVIPSKKTTGTKPRRTPTVAAGVPQGETRAPSSVDKTGANKAWQSRKTKRDGDSTDGGDKNSSSKKRRGSNGGKDNRGEASKCNGTTEDLPTTVSVETTVSSLPSPTSAAATKPLSSPPNRSGDTAGMAPSVEFHLLRQAREAAKKEAAASGGGRRPRAPSRRALEASGQLKHDGAQWMTRERKAEEARFKAELREQRRQYKAAGLKSGVVLEAFVAEAAGTGTVGDGVGNGVAGELGVGSATTKHGRDPAWQKVSPKMLVASPEQEQATKQEEQRSASAEERPSKRPRPPAAPNSTPRSESPIVVEDVSRVLDGPSSNRVA
ncbi:unnamed protein product [Ectocarpus sp. 12 AP-2014]